MRYKKIRDMLLVGSLLFCMSACASEEDIPLASSLSQKKEVSTSTSMSLSVSRENVIRKIRKLAAEDGSDFGIYLAYGNEPPVISDEKMMRSASMIKVFILAEAMEQASKGKLSLTELMVLYGNDKVGGAGILIGYPNNTVFSMEEILRLMITESDNTATNMMIERLGMDSINSYIQTHGYHSTILRRKMMDAEAVKAGRENMTSPRDLGIFFSRLYQNQCVNDEYDQKMRDILFQQTDTECFPSALPMAHIAHKTGELDGLYHDGGIIYEENGQDFVLVILTDSYTGRASVIQTMQKMAQTASDF